MKRKQKLLNMIKKIEIIKKINEETKENEEDPNHPTKVLIKDEIDKFNESKYLDRSLSEDHVNISWLDPCEL